MHRPASSQLPSPSSGQWSLLQSKAQPPPHVTPLSPSSPSVNGFDTMENCLPAPWAKAGKGFCFCSSGIKIHFGSGVAVLWAGSELSRGLISCIAFVSGVEEWSAKGEKVHHSFLMTFYTINQDYVSLVIRAGKISAGSPYFCTLLFS